MKRQSLNNEQKYMSIKTAIENECKISDLASDSRAQIIVKARYVYMGLSREILGNDFNLAECGYYINRDHSNLINGLFEFDREVVSPTCIMFWIYKNVCNAINHKSRLYTDMTTGILRDHNHNPYKYRISNNQNHPIVL